MLYCFKIEDIREHKQFRGEGCSMITIKNDSLIKALSHGKNSESSLSLGDMIDLFAQIIMSENDMVDDASLQKLLCKETRSYCDFDPGMQEGSKIISGAKHSTENIIAAVKSNDSNALNSACAELEAYQKRIVELEEHLHTDELTKFLNRRYLFANKLENGLILRDEGVLFLLQVDGFRKINEKFGYAIGDSVLTFFARNLGTLVNPKAYEIIRFSGAGFIIMVKEHQAEVLERKLKGFQSSLKSHKFKVTESDVLELNFLYGNRPYKEGEVFDAVLLKTAKRLS